MTGFDCESVFVDTAPFIYLLEDNDHYIEKMQFIFNYLIENSVSLFTSAITFEEYLVHPYRTRQIEKETAFLEFIQDANIHVIPVDIAIAKKAAKIRAKHPSFKAMDAMQLAAAMQCGCDGFLTNDKQLQSFAGITCLLVDEWGIAQ